MMYFAENLACTLESAYNEGTSLQPRPAEMLEMEEQLRNSQNGQTIGAPTFEEFLEQKCELVHKIQDASRFKEFLAAMGDYLNIPTMAVQKMEATRRGFSGHPAGSKRVVKSDKGFWRLK